MVRGYEQGHRRIYGLPVRIENRVGSIRRGKETDGTQWSSRMHVPYGYFKNTPGLDGGELDVFIGPDPKAPDVYLITTMRYPDYVEPDEIKVMAGFHTAADARRCFDSHYPDKHRAFGYMRRVTVSHFQALLAQCREHGVPLGP